MPSAPTLPGGNDNEAWYKYHVIQRLDELKDSQRIMLENQTEMHEANIKRMEEISETLHEHEEADQQMFSSIRQDISGLQPVKKIVYGLIALILVAFATALITSVVVSRQPSPIERPK